MNQGVRSQSAAADGLAGWQPAHGGGNWRAGPQWSVNLAFDLENFPLRSDIELVNLSLAPNLHLVYELAVFNILLRQEQFATRELILDRSGNLTRKPIDGHIILEGDCGPRTR